MALATFSRANSRRKSSARPCASSPRVAPGETVDESRLSPIDRTSFSPTAHLNIDDYVKLLFLIEDGGGVATLHEIAYALPAVAQPITAILDLCDAGVLGIDLLPTFGGNTRVWRVND